MASNRWCLKEWEFIVNDPTIDLHNKYEIESYMEKLKDDINKIQQEILMYCSATPNNIISDKEKDIMGVIPQIKDNVLSLFEYLKELWDELFKIETIYNEYECSLEEDFILENDRKKLKKLTKIYD